MDDVPRSLTVLLAALVLVMVSPSPADAHASLVATSPEDGSRIATAPPSVELTFSEDVDTGFVAVTAPDGTKVTTSEPRITGADVTVDLAQSDQRGRFAVAYRIVSEDGHPVTGEFTFTTTEGRHVSQEDASPEESFGDRYGTLLVVGLAVAVLAIAVMLAPLTRRRRV
jgi:methionine-rich copper-binding protein CopC